MEKEEKLYWDLLAKKLHSELDESDQSYFDKLSYFQGNQQIYRKAEQIKDGLNAIKPVYGIDSEASWNRIRRSTYRNFVASFATHAIKYAAIILISLLIGNYIHSFKNSSDPIQYAEIEVLNGQMGHVFLFDGTEVWLNSGSKFKYPNHFNKNERNVYLDGEAYFKVAHNKELPFKVKTENVEVEVLGTSFNISAYRLEQNQLIVLEKGSVQINQLNGEKLLKLCPGQLAERSNKTKQIQVRNVRTNQYTSWKNGIIVFESESLGEIAKKLERWYNVEIRFENENLKQYRITGTLLRNKPIDQTIKAIELLSPIKYEYVIKTDQKDIITIKKK